MFSATNCFYYADKEYKVKMSGLSINPKWNLDLLKLETIVFFSSFEVAK